VRFVTDCPNCGAVALPATGITLLSRTGSGFEGRFECPVCQQVGATSIDPPVVPTLVAQGAGVLTQTHTGVAALTPDDLAEFRRVLDDDEACRRFLDGLA
jgi:hypothetical protein